MREPLRSKPPAFATLKPSSDTKELDASLAALNKSAERLQTLWFTFLGVSLYFAISALTTTHMQLLLEEPKQLPIVNLTVPLLSFFVIAPAFYVVIHVYFLMMLVLLARTAHGFEAQLQKAVPALGKQEAYRLRVENALFLQLLSGMDEERRGMNGRVLAGVALVTLAVAPVLVLLLFQFMFLPYQHFALTWWHRVLVIFDLAAIVVLWNAYRRGDGMVSARAAVGDWWRQGWIGRVASGAVALAACYATLMEGRWAGEPALWRCEIRKAVDEALFELACPIRAEGAQIAATENGRMFGLFPDRLKLLNETIVGKKLLEEKQAEALSSGGTRRVVTRTFDGRNFLGAVFSGADLRRVTFSNVQLRGASLNDTQLQGASFFRAQLQGASLESAQLQGASLFRARLHGALLDRAQLQGAWLDFAQLQGASLESAQLQGASLREAQLQGASLAGAGLQGASFEGAQLQGTSLEFAQLHGAWLWLAQLQGASLRESSVFGARGLEDDTAFTGAFVDVDVTPRWRNVRESLIGGTIDELTPATIERWRNAAVEHQNERTLVTDMERRFSALAELLNEPEVTRTEARRWTSIDDAQLDHEVHAVRKFAELSKVACAGTDADYVARRLIRRTLSVRLLEHFLDARSGRADCAGIAAFLESDWRLVAQRLIWFREQPENRPNQERDQDDRTSLLQPLRPTYRGS